MEKDVNSQANFEKITKSLIAYHTLKVVQTSPYYFESMKTNLFVMIQQLETLTFCVGFTNVEHI